MAAPQRSLPPNVIDNIFARLNSLTAASFARASKEITQICKASNPEVQQRMKVYNDFLTVLWNQINTNKDYWVYKYNLNNVSRDPKVMLLNDLNKETKAYLGLPDYPELKLYVLPSYSYSSSSSSVSLDGITFRLQKSEEDYLKYSIYKKDDVYKTAFTAEDDVGIATMTGQLFNLGILVLLTILHINNQQIVPLIVDVTKNNKSLLLDAQSVYSFVAKMKEDFFEYQPDNLPDNVPTEVNATTFVCFTENYENAHDLKTSKVIKEIIKKNREDMDFFIKSIDSVSTTPVSTNQEQNIKDFSYTLKDGAMHIQYDSSDNTILSVIYARHGDKIKITTDGTKQSCSRSPNINPDMFTTIQKLLNGLRYYCTFEPHHPDRPSLPEELMPPRFENSNLKTILDLIHKLENDCAIQGGKTKHTASFGPQKKIGIKTTAAKKTSVKPTSKPTKTTAAKKTSVKPTPKPTKTTTAKKTSVKPTSKPTKTTAAKKTSVKPTPKPTKTTAAKKTSVKPSSKTTKPSRQNSTNA